MIRITRQMRVLVAIEPVDGRKGIDSLARLCQEKLAEDPFPGWVFIFRSRSGTTVRLLTYDGQGKALTVFRRSPGAPLDNNICERALKKAILNRKNSLFYKTLHGAQVGDLYMSLIHTCELNAANPFDYLTELHRHAEELQQDPATWMACNYHRTPANS